MQKYILESCVPSKLCFRQYTLQPTLFIAFPHLVAISGPTIARAWGERLPSIIIIVIIPINPIIITCPITSIIKKQETLTQQQL